MPPGYPRRKPKSRGRGGPITPRQQDQIDRLMQEFARISGKRPMPKKARDELV